MSFARIFSLAQRIMRQIIRDRRTLALIFVIPIVLMTLLYLVLSNTTTVYTLALVRPEGVGSERINTLIDQALPGSDKLKTRSIAADQVDSTLKNGDADAALVFPSDFMDQLTRGQKPSVQVALEGSDPNVASVMRQQAEGIARQVGILLTLSRPASGVQGQLPDLKQLPFTLAEPRYLYGGSDYTSTDALAPVFIGIFSFFFVFLLTSVSFLRERSQGTIERVLVSPLKRAELVTGYICGFALFALVQALVILLFVVFVLRVHYSGNLALVFLVSLLLTIGSVNLGIFLSTFARNEFQVVQFIPLILGVQIFLSGVFWPIKQLPALLQPFTYLLPLTYANDALRSVMLKGMGFTQIWQQLGALLVFALLMVGLSALTMRREAA